MLHILANSTDLVKAQISLHSTSHPGHLHTPWEKSGWVAVDMRDSGELSLEDLWCDILLKSPKTVFTVWKTRLCQNVWHCVASSGYYWWFELFANDHSKAPKAISDQYQQHWTFFWVQMSRLSRHKISAEEVLFYKKEKCAVHLKTWR